MFIEGQPIIKQPIHPMSSHIYRSHLFSPLPYHSDIAIINCKLFIDGNCVIVVLVSHMEYIVSYKICTWLCCTSFWWVYIMVLGWCMRFICANSPGPLHMYSVAVQVTPIGFGQIDHLCLSTTRHKERFECLFLWHIVTSSLFCHGMSGC